MSIGSRRPAAGSPPPNANAFLVSFTREAHELLLLGFARLAPALGPKRLAHMHEPEITGELVEAIRSVADEAHGATKWAWRYTAHDDPPVTTRTGAAAKRRGKRRPRIDIVLEQCVQGRPHPRFGWEAKRLRDGESVGDYLGSEGLGALVSGYYGSSHVGLGMLGYVQREVPEAWRRLIQSRLAANPRRHRLANAASPWTPLARSGALRTTLVSEHVRRGGRLRVYHTFLQCS